MMKSNLHRSLLVFCVMAASAVAAQAQGLIKTSDYVRVNVFLTSRAEKPDPKKRDENRYDPSVKQIYKLKIVLDGKARESETRKVKWTIYGRDLKDKSIKEVESGTFDLALKDGTQREETKDVQIKYTPRYTDMQRPDYNQMQRNPNYIPNSRQVEASGVKFMGYSAVVMDGDKVVGEYYDPSGLKSEVGNRKGL